MSAVTITELVTSATITENVVSVAVALSGAQGPTGATGPTGPTGPTGATGASGVVSVTAPITNGGTPSAAIIGINQSALTLTESQITNLVTDLAAKAVTATTISTTTPLTGGGDLSASRTIALTLGSGLTTNTGALVPDATIVPLLASGNVFTNVQQITIPSAATKGLIVKGAVGQSANLAEWQNSAGAVIAYVNSAGGISCSALFNGSAGYYSATANFRAAGANESPLVLRGVAGQVASLQEWQTSTPTTVAKVDASGIFTAASIIKSGGTSTQALMADGSVTTPQQRWASEWGFTSTATAAGTTRLTNASTIYQLFTGTTTQTLVLPSTATLATGWTFMIDNDSTGVVTVQTSTAAALTTIPGGVSARFTVVSTAGDTAAAWDWGYNDFNTLTGTGACVLGTSPSIATPTVTGTATMSGAVLETGALRYEFQPNPTALTATSTLTVAQLQTRLITETSATAVTATLPTGTLMDGGMPAGIAVNQSFDWTIINLGSASGAVTVAAGTGHTVVGSMSVPISTSATFRSRRTAANTWITYRL